MELVDFGDLIPKSVYQSFTNLSMIKTLEKRNISEEHFIEVSNSSISASEACKKLGMRFSTYKRVAQMLNCYHTNQSGKGIKKVMPKVPLEKILSNEVQCQSYKLKLRLFEAGLLEDKCSICGWAKKREGEKFTPCELDHINGDHFDNRLENLRIICPNCHSLTPTYRSKNLKLKNI